MPQCDTLIRGVQVLDGGGGDAQTADVAVTAGLIADVGNLIGYSSPHVFESKGQALAPGFIDAHTHDDLYALREPQMLPKLSQGVTTVIAGNCGISGAPTRLTAEHPDPANLLGTAQEFRYPTFADYVTAVRAVVPAVNIAALVGHTTLRSNHMDRLDRSATSGEVAAMRAQLDEALDHGALGLSTGLAYLSANAASEEEVLALAQPLTKAHAIYATHLRSESDKVLEAIEEACLIGKKASAAVVVSHLKCAGVDNWHRSAQLLRTLDTAATEQPIGWDCYPYAASSSTLDVRQVDPRVTIQITWSDSHPEMSGLALAQIAENWGVSQIDAARRLQPAGAIYHCMSEDDVRRILRHPATMIGSDGLPNDPRPHPRLWGTFPRVLGHYCRHEHLFSLGEAIRRMTSLPASRFGLTQRGWVRPGYAADLVLFNPETVRDNATFGDPERPATGIDAVWVNGVLSFSAQRATGQRAGRFLSRPSAAQ